MNFLFPHADPVTTPNERLSEGDPGCHPKPLRFGHLDEYWSHFDSDLKRRDEEMIGRLKAHLNTLLIFAALFSAVNSGFLTLTMPMLSADPAAQTNHLLTLLVQGVDNSTLTPADLKPTPFSPSPQGIRVNQLLSISLSLSMIASFGALLGQQWIMCYQRPSEHLSGSHRWELARQLWGADVWGFQSVLEVYLTFTLQVALLVFMVACITFLQGLSPSVALPNTILVSVGAILSLFTFFFALWDPFCPFQTPLSTYTIWYLQLFRRWFMRQLDELFPGRFDLSTPHHLFTLRKSPISENVLSAEFVRRALWESTNEELLRTVARNVPLIDDFAGVGQIYNSLYSMERFLKRIRSAEEGSAEQQCYSAAVCHLVLMGHTQKSRRRKESLGRYTEEFQRIAKLIKKNPSDPSSLLPTSMATVATLSVISQHLSTRDSEFLSSAIASAENPTFAIGISSWALLNSPDYIYEEAQRERGLSDLGFASTREPNLHRHTALQNAASATQALLGRDKSRTAAQVALEYACYAIHQYRPGIGRPAHAAIIAILNGMPRAFEKIGQDEQAEIPLEKILKALEPLFAADLEHPAVHEQKIQWERATDAALSLVSDILLLPARSLAIPTQGVSPVVAANLTGSPTRPDTTQHPKETLRDLVQRIEAKHGNTVVGEQLKKAYDLRPSDQADPSPSALEKGILTEPGIHEQRGHSRDMPSDETVW